MKRNHEELIAILSQSEKSLSSTKIAESLGVTPRSVKNYVSQINRAHPGLILSSSRGYLLDRNLPVKHNVTEVPQTHAERSQYVIHRFFIEHEESIDLYDLCDELYLSYSSIKNLIGRMNREYRELHVSFRCRGERVYLEGSERDKRRFLTRAIFRESSGYFVDRKAIKKLFEPAQVDTIDGILHGIVGAHGLSVSDFGYANLLLHMAIAVDRMQNGNALGGGPTPVENLQLVTVDIITQLRDGLHVDFDEAESIALDEQVRMTLLPHPARGTEALIADVGIRNYQVTRDIIEGVNSRYHLRLDCDALQLPLALHIKNLIIRCKRGAILQNPFLDMMQIQCPVLFDCAVYAAERLQDEFNVRIPKDEVAYIAMHIGADIERQNREDGKLAFVLLCPDYHNNRRELTTALLDSFGAQLTLVASCGQEDEIPHSPFDVLFTTVQPTGTYPEIIGIPPMRSALNIKMIAERLQVISERLKLRVISECYRTFFRPDLFIHYADRTQTRDEAIRELAGLLQRAGYVTLGYLEDVLRREAAASTAFYDVAIPHSMNMNAQQTGIALAIAPEGIAWGDRCVHVVLLVAISEQDLPLFQELYEALILLFSQESFARRLLGCKTFEEFGEILLSCAS